MREKASFITACWANRLSEATFTAEVTHTLVARCFLHNTECTPTRQELARGEALRSAWLLDLATRNTWISQLSAEIGKAKASSKKKNAAASELSVG